MVAVVAAWLAMRAGDLDGPAEEAADGFAGIPVEPSAAPDSAVTATGPDRSRAERTVRDAVAQGGSAPATVATRNGAEGWVIDWSSGEPVPHAVIRDPNVDDTLGETDENGWFRIGMPDSRQIFVEIGKAGYCRIRGKLEQRRAPYVLRLPQSAGVEGRVRNVSGGRVAGLDVVLHRGNLPSLRDDEPAWDLPDGWDVRGASLVATTDAEGRFRLGGALPAVRGYRVHVRAEDVEGRVRVPRTAPAGRFSEVDLLVRKAPARGGLRGRVTAGGLPMDGWIQWQGARRGGTAWASGGVWECEGVEAGWVKVSLIGAGELVRDVLVREDAVTQCDIELAERYRVHRGRVVYASGAGVPRIAVAYGDAQGRPWYGRTDANGEYVALVPRESDVVDVVLKRRGVTYRRTTRDLEGGSPWVIEDEGTVLVETNAPPALEMLASVSCRRVGAEAWSRGGLEDGNRFRLPAGSWEMKIDMPGYTSTVVRVDVVVGRVQPVTVEMREQ